jgi:predicted house-cleaning noncanonical NTP pyrophosphatase (MazG superfamily)
MPIFIFNKIIREQFLKKLEQCGGSYTYEDLSEAEAIKELKLKLLEEAEEVAQAEDAEDILEELSDVMEVVDQLLTKIGSSFEELELARSKKENSRGRLRPHQKILTVTIPSESQDLQQHLNYLRSEPVRYPEVNDNFQ